MHNNKNLIVTNSLFTVMFAFILINGTVSEADAAPIINKALSKAASSKLDKQNAMPEEPAVEAGNTIVAGEASDEFFVLSLKDAERMAKEKQLKETQLSKAGQMKTAETLRLAEQVIKQADDVKGHQVLAMKLRSEVVIKKTIDLIQSAFQIQTIEVVSITDQPNIDDSKASQAKKKRTNSIKDYAKVSLNAFIAKVRHFITHA